MGFERTTLLVLATGFGPAYAQADLFIWLDREGDVTITRGPDGVDRLVGVEVLRFDDGEVVLE